MRKGFTLIELMVASILLAMIVTILTMVFNQSSVVWRTGVASVANLNDSRSALGESHDIRDDLLPGLGDKNPSVSGADGRTVRYRTVSLWDTTQANQLRTKNQRAFNFDDPTIHFRKAKSFTMTDAQTAQSLDVLDAKDSPQEKSAFSVGVRSWGPDGKPDTPDDISTWPEEVD